MDSLVVRPRGDHRRVSGTVAGRPAIIALVTALTWLGIGITQAAKTGSWGWAFAVAAGIFAVALLSGVLVAIAFDRNARLLIDHSTLTYYNLAGRQHHVPVDSVAQLRRLAIELQPGTGYSLPFLVWASSEGHVLLRVPAWGWKLEDLRLLAAEARWDFDESESQFSLSEAARQYPGLFSWYQVHWRLILCSALVAALVGLGFLVTRR